MTTTQRVAAGGIAVAVLAGLLAPGVASAGGAEGDSLALPPRPSPGSGKTAGDEKARAAPGARAKASPATLRLVRFFIKTFTGDLPPERVPEFMEVDPETLPRDLKRPYLAKREELRALKRIADGNKKPPIRRLGIQDPAACADPYDGETGLWILGRAGYTEIYEDEERRLETDTECSLCELETEFSLRRLLWTEGPRKSKARRKDEAKGKAPAVEEEEHASGKARAKGAKPRTRFFLHMKDPLMSLVGAYRAGRKAFGTNFFGIGNPRCH